MSTITRPAPGEVWKRKNPRWTAPTQFTVAKVCDTHNPPHVIGFWDDECDIESYMLDLFLMYFHRVSPDADH